MRKYIILAFFLISCCVGLQAQNSTQGKEFWFTFMQNGYKNNGGAWVSNRVMISAKRACSGVIKKADGSLSDIHFSLSWIFLRAIPITSSMKKPLIINRWCWWRQIPSLFSSATLPITLSMPLLCFQSKVWVPTISFSRVSNRIVRIMMISKPVAS